MSKDELPAGWARTTLEPLGKLYCGQSLTASKVNRDGKGVPYVTGPEQWDGEKVHQDKWTTEPARMVPDGCIFITVKGAGVGKLFPGIACAIGRDVYAYEPSPELPRKFIELSLRFTIAEVVAEAKGDIPGLSKNHILDHSIPLPPLAEQKRIVAKIEELFSELDAGEESLRRARRQLGVYRQSLLKQAFEGKLTAPWRAQHPDLLESPDQLLARIKAERQARYQQQLKEWEKAGGGRGKPKKPEAAKPITEKEAEALAELPVGWAWTYMANVGDLGRGKSKHRPRNAPELFGGKYPFIQTGEVKASTKVVKEFTQTYSEVGLAQSKLWPAGTLCITIAANIAETAFLGFDACFPDSVVGFVPMPALVFDEYVELFIRSARSRIEEFAPATAQKNINLTTLENLVVPLCTLPEQQEIVRQLDEQFEVIEQNEREIDAALKRSEALRQSILRKAFTGQLVPPACRQAGKTPEEFPQPKPGKWWVYVIRCDDGSFYKGFTDDLPKRWRRHLAGNGAKWTKQHPPVELFYWEEHWSEASAVERERYLKSGSGREWFQREIVANEAEYEPAYTLLARIRKARGVASRAPKRKTVRVVAKPS